MKTIVLIRQYPRKVKYRKDLFRSFFLTLSLICFFYKVPATEVINSGSIKISIIDNETRETIPFAHVVAYQKDVQVAVGTTNIDGECLLNNLAPGKYDIKGVYVGYQAQEVKNVEVQASKINAVVIKLNSGGIILCCFCCDDLYEDQQENWWPKLWTPYREGLAALKEKRSKKLAEREVKNQKLKSKVNNAEAELITETIDTTAAVRNVAKKPDEAAVKVYPNPCIDILHVQSAMPVQDLRLLDAGGKMIYEMPETLRADIDLNGFAKGMYYLTYGLNGKNELTKVLVGQ